nr:MAG TPA: hypothetical protein [Caudoviricetes sp.]DAT25762.1 MAG TPA: hypothetical protein [Caudoviricetes sp.]DAZ73959.1 MAG TPA: hypothetical protein [Caudoviricetes sp.]
MYTSSSVHRLMDIFSDKYRASIYYSGRWRNVICTLY